MYPDFLEAFGLDLYGLQFERAFWLMAIGFALWGLWGGIQQVREGLHSSGWMRTVLSVGALIWFGWHAARAWFMPGNYQLFFREEMVIHSYALAIVTGFLLAVWIAAREGARVGIPPSRILDLAFWALILGLAGARLLFMLVSVEDYVNACVAPEKVGLVESDCLLALRFWKGGLVFYGAFLGGAAAVVWYALKHKMRISLLMDTCAPSLALAHAFGRLGCIGAGCCWGEVCTSGWGLVFHRGEMPFDDLRSRWIEFGSNYIDPSTIDAGRTMPLHPVQLYEAYGELAIFVVLLLWRPRKRVHGEIVALWMACYGFFRALTEMMRGDKVRGYLVEVKLRGLNELLGLPLEHPTFLTTSQIIGFALGFGGIGLLVFLRWRGRRQRERNAEVEPAIA